MKKTLSIHLGRMLFVIEEDAYDRLQQYLQRLESSLEGEEGKAEIIEDIEMRFAELLTSYLGETRKVVTISDIQQGVTSLGEPEEFTDEVHATQEKTAPINEATANERGERRLFRDPENGLLGGVCSGISAYLNVDPVFVRIVFVIFFFMAFGTMLYIILWAIIPSAKTPSERLQMQGRKVTVDSLKEEFVKATGRIKDETLQARDRFQANSPHLFNRAKHITSLIGRIVGMGLLAGAFFWLTFFMLVTTGLIDLIPVTGDDDYASFFEFMRLVMPAGQTFTLFKTAVILVGLSGPIIAILLGLRMIMQRPHRIIRINLIVFPFILFTGLILGLISGLQGSRDYAVYEEASRTHATVDAEVLEVSELPHFSGKHRIVSSGGIDFINISNNYIEDEGILIRYRPSKDSSFHIDQILSARGIDKDAARKRYTKIEHQMRIEGNKLLIDPLYRFPSSDGMRDQDVEIVIEVPAGKRLIIKDKEMTSPQSTGNFYEYFGGFYANEPFRAEPNETIEE